MASQPYSEEFFSRLQGGSAESARVIAPLVVQLLAPTSIIDVGCACGAWLSAFERQGVRDVFGVDGEWVDRKALLCAQDRFRPVDLKQPLNLDRTFDMAM